MKKPSLAIVRGKFLNAYEMQMFEPLVDRYDIRAFGSFTCYHDRFAFPVVKLASPMDIPDFPCKLPILNRLFVDAHYLVGLERKLRGFDIIHTAETYFHFTQQCLNARGRAKVVATVLENIPFNNEAIWGRKAFKRRAREELDHIVALTNRTRDALIREGADPQKITVIPHYIDTTRFHPAARRNTTKRLTVLFAGRLEEEKGVLDVLGASRFLEGDRELSDYSIRWLFVGSGSIRIRGRRARVTSVAYGHMPQVYREADIFVAPSKPTPTWEEQYSTVLLEAQASGLPIVTTQTGGIPENVADAAILVPPGDVAAIARAIKAFIVDPALRFRYGRMARRRAVTVHDRMIGAKKLDLLYQSLL